MPVAVKVYEEEVAREFAAAPSATIEFAEIAVETGLPPFPVVESWKKLLKEEPEEALPWLVTVPEKVSA